MNKIEEIKKELEKSLGYNFNNWGKGDLQMLKEIIEANDKVNIMKEIFKDIPNCEGLYQISNFGRVKSLKFNRERILKPAPNNYGYLFVILYCEGKQKNITVHQIMAIVFLNHTPCGHKIVVDHINCDKQDNRLENLQLISQRENSSKDRKGSSKYTGVCWDKRNNKWLSVIRINGKQKHLGYFNCELEASAAYQSKLKALSNLQ